MSDLAWTLVLIGAFVVLVLVLRLTGVWPDDHPERLAEDEARPLPPP